MFEGDLFPVDETLLAVYRKSVEAALPNFPRKARRQFEASSEAERDRWFRERFKCLKYHLYLSGYAESTKAGDPDLPKEYVPIMGMDFVPDPHALLFSHFVQKRPGENMVFSDLDQAVKKRMILWPRGLFKTSSVIVDIVQTILNYPNICICFLTGGDTLAKRQLQRVKRVFERPSPMFAVLFPEFCYRDVRNRQIKDENDQRAWTSEPAKLGTAHEFTVPCRTKEGMAEPTFAISTARSVKSGAHFDVIYIDDLVNDQNYRSAKALEKSYQDYLDICPVLDPAGFMVVTGTRYAFGDTYEMLQDTAKDEMKKLGKTIWQFFIRDCWSHGCQNCPHTDVYHNYEANILQPPCGFKGCRCPGYKNRGDKGVLFPVSRTRDGKQIGQSIEFLEGERVRTSDEFFANQYENRPIAIGSQVFTEAMIGAQTVFEERQLPPYAASYTFIVGDLAYVGAPGRDFSVLFAVRKFQGRLFIFDCLYGNWDAAAIAENTLNFLLKHRPNDMYYERFNGWEAYNNVITSRAAALGIDKVPLQWLKGSQADKAKLARIGSVKGPLQNGRLWFYASMPGYPILVQQLCKWPKWAKHDDFADCAGMVVAAPTGYELETPPPTTSQLDWLRKLNRTSPLDDSYGDSGCGTGICC
jgi:predicted phage terminase large subunit-like protein